MSIHHLERAASLPIQATQKLVLMALCDDADKTTGLAMPGIEKVMQWAGCGRSQAADHMSALIDAGYVARITKGHRGQRAVYRVFASVACCAEHPVPIESGTPDANSGVEGDAIGSGQPDANPESEQPNGSGVPDAIEVSGIQKESGWPDAKSSNASDAPDAKSERVRKGSGKGPAHRTPPLTPELPLPPTEVVGAHANTRKAHERIAAGERTPAVLVAEWLEHADPRPPKRFIGQVAKAIKALIDEDTPFEAVRAGIVEWHNRNLHPSTLESVVYEIRRSPGVRPGRAGQREAQDDALAKHRAWQAEMRQTYGVVVFDGDTEADVRARSEARGVAS